MKLNKFTISLLALLLMSSVACKKEKSSNTGWNYNDSKWGGFEKHEYAGQETGPGLVLVHGGAFTMGSSEQDVTYEHNNIERKVTVPSFYMDETEVTNSHYREYVFWLSRVYLDYPEVGKNALPDTNVWRNRLAYNEPYVDL
ncbi:MAG: gliding motility-associated lipoprotein GldJ, partial [Bacteroidia bacterium]